MRRITAMGLFGLLVASTDCHPVGSAQDLNVPPGVPPTVVTNTAPLSATGPVPSSASGMSQPLSPFARVCDRVDREQRGILLRERRTAARDHPGTVRPAVPSVETPPEDTDPAALLAVRLREHAKAIARAEREHNTRMLWILNRSAPATDALVTVSSSLYPSGACEPSGPRGAWSFEASDVTLDISEMGPHWRAHLSLVHYDELFLRTAIPLTECCGEMFDGQLQNDLPVVFDFNGDGAAEVYVHAIETHESSGSGGEAGAGVYTFRDHAIVPYGPTSKLDLFGGPTDADHDGRPDLHSHGRIDVRTGPPDACREDVQRYAPDFLVHALPDGTFSLTDDVARAYARAWCPASPAVITGVVAAGCARLWASTPAKLASERVRVAESCVEIGRAKCEARLPHLANEIFECNLRSEAFAADPPLTLP